MKIARRIVAVCAFLIPGFAGAELYVATLSGLAGDYPLPVQTISTTPTLIFQGVGDIRDLQVNIGATILPLQSATIAWDFRSEVVGPLIYCTASPTCSLTILSTADPTFQFTDLFRFSVPHDIFFAAPNLPYDFTFPAAAVTSAHPPPWRDFSSAPGATVRFTLAPIPEPATFAFGIAGLAAGLFLRKARLGSA